MEQHPLFEAVATFAQLTHPFSDADLDQPWTWRAHQEGVRFAMLGTYHELRDLAVELAQIRDTTGPAVTAAQRAIGQYHAAYRDFQAVLLGASDAVYEQAPAAGEWSLRRIVGHIIDAERYFFTLVHYALARWRDGGKRPAELPEGELDRVVGPDADFFEMAETQEMAQLLAYYGRLHQRVLAEFAAMSDAERAILSPWWEEEAVSLQYRLHRFDAHLRQHTIQLEKTLDALGQPLTEAKRHLRLIYQATADVENAVLGAPGVGTQQCQALAETVLARAEAVTRRVTQARQLVAAVAGGDLDQVTTLLAAEPALVNGVDQNHISAVLTAVYRRHQAIVEALVEAGAWLSIFEAAAIGRLDLVQREIERRDDLLNAYGRDGFTPLQLACFFGHESIALWLIERGADVNAVARNNLRIAPVHAASASGNLSLLTSLLQHGAEANAKQQNDFTPLHTAADHGDAAMIQLLLDHGADIHAATEDGRTPLDVALAKGHDHVASLLR